MKRLSGPALLLTAALGTALAAAATAAPIPAAVDAGTPAEWRSFDLLVDLTGLPQRYTCNELWYRLHDLLLAIGARPYPQIFTFHCGTTRATSSRSPSVHLEFQLPRPLPTADVRYEQFAVTRATVPLGPGTLRSFTAADCELLRQLDALLLPQLPVHPLGAGLACPAAPTHRSFALEVQALIPSSSGG